MGVPEPGYASLTQLRNAAGLHRACAGLRRGAAPVTVIIGMVQILLNKMLPDDPQRLDIEAIHEAGQRINEIAKKMGKIQQYVTKSYVGKTDIVDFDSAAQEG